MSNLIQRKPAPAVDRKRYYLVAGAGPHRGHYFDGFDYEYGVRPVARWHPDESHGVMITREQCEGCMLHIDIEHRARPVPIVRHHQLALEATPSGHAGSYQVEAVEVSDYEALQAEARRLIAQAAVLEAEAHRLEVVEEVARG